LIRQLPLSSRRTSPRNFKQRDVRGLWSLAGACDFRWTGTNLAAVEVGDSREAADMQTMTSHTMPHPQRPPELSARLRRRSPYCKVRRNKHTCQKTWLRLINSEQNLSHCQSAFRAYGKHALAASLDCGRYLYSNLCILRIHRCMSKEAAATACQKQLCVFLKTSMELMVADVRKQG